MIYNPPPTPQPAQPFAPPPSAPEAAEQSQTGRASRTGWTRYTIVFGAVVAGLTALALILAALAPSFGDAGGVTIPTNWTTQYHGDLTTPTATDYKTWNPGDGCAFYSTGLDATANGSDDALCDFTPAGNGGQTTSGFYLELTVAPPAAVPNYYEESLLLIGDPTGQDNSLVILVDQSGTYTVCTTAICAANSQGAPYATGISDAWHGGGFVSNTIGVLVSADHQSETLFINHQRVSTVSLALIAEPAIAIGAPGETESLYTAATFSTGQ